MEPQRNPEFKGTRHFFVSTFNWQTMDICGNEIGAENRVERMSKVQIKSTFPVPTLFIKTKPERLPPSDTNPEDSR